MVLIFPTPVQTECFYCGRTAPRYDEQGMCSACIEEWDEKHDQEEREPSDTDNWGSIGDLI